MSDLDLPASMKPKLAAIETAIREACDDIRVHGRKAVEAALHIGRELTAAKAIIVPQQWMRWCDESLPFGDSYARVLMKLFAEYKPLKSPEQIRLLESATSVKSAIRLLDSKPAIGETPPHRGAESGPQVTDPEGESAIEPPKTPIDDSEEKQENEPPPESEQPEPDPWQPVKQEVRDVYARVNASLKQLKEDVHWARGYGVFEGVGAIEQDMASIKNTLAAAKPNQVCETCRPGTPAQAKSCRVCYSVGMVPKCVNERQRK